MPTTLFLHSEIENPYKLYETMLQNPVYWDSVHNLWAVYSYQSCKALLLNSSAHIPATDDRNTAGLNEYALLIAGNLARLSNGIRHEMAKHSALLLLNNMKAIATEDLIEKLIETKNNKHELDWVESICKKLPLTVVLRSFDFNREDCDFILSKTEQLVKIMLPITTPEQVAAINEISKAIYVTAEKILCVTNFYKPLVDMLSKKYNITPDETASLLVSNTIGLFIQSYDAGRGILSNSLLQVINNSSIHREHFTSKDYVEKNVIETLRFDPPVHNTRRIAGDDIFINNKQIKKGQSIFIVLAAANRDPAQFNDPNIYNPERPNNAEHLTFGIGGHKCPANHLSVKLATETLCYLFERYKTIQLIEKNISYEPIINARLPRQIFISLS